MDLVIGWQAFGLSTARNLADRLGAEPRLVVHRDRSESGGGVFALYEVNSVFQ